MRFEFAAAGRIVFGAGALEGIGALAAEIGSRALLVTGRGTGRSARLRELLSAAGVSVARYAVDGEPTIDCVRAGTEAARSTDCSLVIGFGGGSAIDAGKAIAALLTNGGDPLDYLEGIGAGRALRLPSAPFIAIPTTAGTGAEVTRNSVLGSPEHRVKLSLRSPYMLPRLAVVDPDLSAGLPPDITAVTGLDALTQLLEAFVTPRANPITDAFCRDGMLRAARSLRRACAEGEDPAARKDMALAALFSGLALANAGQGAVHGFAGPLGGMVRAPHGAVCARLLSAVMRVNLAALRQRDPNGPALARYAEAARILTGDAAASADDGQEWIEALTADLHIPPLSTYGLKPEELPLLLENAARASSMQANPIKLTDPEMEAILLRAL